MVVLLAIANNYIDVFHNRYIVEISVILDLLKIWEKKYFIYGFLRIRVMKWQIDLQKRRQKKNLISVSRFHWKILDENLDKRLGIWTQDRIVNKARFKNQFYFKNFYERNKKKSLFHKLNRQRYFVTLVNRSNHFKLLKCFKMFLAYWILISSESLGHLPYWNGRASRFTLQYS